MVISGKLEGFEKKIEWSIPDFFILADKEDILDSPKFFIGNFHESFYLRIWPSWNDNLMKLFLKTDQAAEYEVECSFGLKKSDLSVVHLGKDILKKGYSYNSRNYIIFKKKELLDKKIELVPGNTLTVVCTVKFGTGTTHSIQEPTLNETPSPTLSRLDKLSENFKDIYADKETCDVILKVKDKEFKAHRIVLMARSHVFSATFKHDTLERQTGIITISDCDPESFEKFLEYLYSGELEELSFRSALNLYYTSNKYDIEELKVYCVDRLMQSLTVENVCEIASLADKHSEAKLFSAVQDFFNINFSHIFLDSDWKILLKSDPNLVDKLLTGMSEMKLKK